MRLAEGVQEEIVIGDNVRLKVVAIQGNQVRLGFTAPREVAIIRQELVAGAAPVLPSQPCGFPEVAQPSL